MTKNKKQVHLDAAIETYKTLKKMETEGQKQIDSKKQDLLDKLIITSQKYLTANGVHAALQSIVSATGRVEHRPDDLISACSIAKQMSNLCNHLCDKAKTTESENMSSILDGIFSDDFIQTDVSFESLALELLILDLCQNIGQDCQTLESIIDTINTQITKTKDVLAEQSIKARIDIKKISELIKDK